MPRPPPTPTTALGYAIQRRRSASQEETAAVIKVPEATLSRLERGTNRPTYDTAVKLAKWLGWTVDQVMEAAALPARDAAN